MPELMTIAIALSPQPSSCVVILDGHDISRCVRALSIEADCFGVPLVTLQIVGKIELLGEAGVQLEEGTDL